ncbi:oxygen-independent coproporphyrinogen III oxidase [Phreatobacter sp.]|uniref:oxygen-independent coproporphyrinogen III oxidase n=1 Tax=Phreatobacter sp. TaxID=1966341 RepID=UPI003F6E7A81
MTGQSGLAACVNGQPPNAMATMTPNPLSTDLPAKRIELAERAVPRYTSYPTAPYFGPEVDGATCRGWLEALSPDDHLSIYLHVPFCAAMCAYCGCHTKVVARDAPVRAYQRRLLAEIDLIAAATPARTVRHIHWGGGTPSMLGAEGLAEIAGRLGRRFTLEEGHEHAIELDPRQVTGPLADALAGMGVTRASLGVQDLNAHVQTAIGRVQPYAVVEVAVAALRGAGIGAVAFDLMYGLPHQSDADLVTTITLAGALRPDRIALFGYAHVPWFKTHQRLIDTAALPDAAGRFRQAALARAALAGLGYQPIGLDHFALPADPMAVAARERHLRRNFQGYTTDAPDALIGFGASAIGRLPQGFVQNAPDIAGYQRAIDRGEPATVRGLALSQEDRVRAAVIERLMCDFAADLDAEADRFGLPASLFDADMERLVALEDEGLVAREGRRVTVPEAGQPFVRVVASVFDAHLARAGRHSTAV